MLWRIDTRYHRAHTRMTSLEYHAFSNHQRMDCLLNNLFLQWLVWANNKENTQSFPLLAYCEGNPPHKGPVMWGTFFILCHQYSRVSLPHIYSYINGIIDYVDGLVQDCSNSSAIYVFCNVGAGLWDCWRHSNINLTDTTLFLPLFPNVHIMSL